MSRPKGLPEYADPPLHEVAISAQFQPPSGYQQIYARDVWELFRDEFPNVSERAASPPNFETFGRPPVEQKRFQFLSKPINTRYWFISDDNSELIQFQPDTLVHNWRKFKQLEIEYPRFDNIIIKFKSELESLEHFFAENFNNNSLKINQCELTYVNLIPIDSPPEINDWIKTQFEDIDDVETVTFNTSRVLKKEDGNPFARFFSNCSTGYYENKLVVDLKFIVRGIGEDSSIAGAIDFMEQGRKEIVTTFDSFTTEYAHQFWGKK